MDILSIGNSFSQDAQRYLHRIAQSDDFTLNSLTCSLAAVLCSSIIRICAVMKRPIHWK